MRRGTVRGADVAPVRAIVNDAVSVPGSDAVVSLDVILTTGRGGSRSRFTTRTLSKMTKLSSLGLAIEEKGSMVPIIMLPAVWPRVAPWACSAITYPLISQVTTGDPVSFVCWRTSTCTHCFPGAPGVSNCGEGHSSVNG